MGLEKAHKMLRIFEAEPLAHLRMQRLETVKVVELLHCIEIQFFHNAKLLLAPDRSIPAIRKILPEFRLQR